jgi:acetyl esterase/lipase
MRPTLFLTLALASAAHAQVRVETIAPLATDPALSGWTANHAAVFSTTAAHRGTLLLFLHGQGGTGTGALELLRTAAEEGYHAVGLTYANDWSPFTFCNGSADPDCALKVRREIITGTDLSSFVNVPRPDSVENRLIKLLRHLDALHPDEGWSSYLEGDTIRWDAIALWGHSQGGGNAGVIAKDHELERCCTSAPAADGSQAFPASWWADHLTAPGRYFGFCHTQDALSQKVAFWNALGAPGPVLDVAVNLPPFGNSRQLSTSIAPAISGQFHNSVVIDNVTPRNLDGSPRYKEVWQYMLTSDAGPPPAPTSWNDVVYASVPVMGGGLLDLHLDIHGASAGSPPHPVLVWIHGGGWQSGSHDQAPSFALALRERGITVASIEYRLSHEAVFPAQIHDCKGAIRYLRANASTYNLDPDRIAVWGSSAGGHLAALVATSGNTASLEGSTGGNVALSSAVLAGAAFYPPTDLINMQPDCALQSVGCTANHDASTSAESKLLGVSGTGQGIGWLRANLANPADPFPALASLAASSNPITTSIRPTRLCTSHTAIRTSSFRSISPSGSRMHSTQRASAMSCTTPSASGTAPSAPRSMPRPPTGSPAASSPAPPTSTTTATPAPTRTSRRSSAASRATAAPPARQPTSTPTATQAPTRISRASSGCWLGATASGPRTFRLAFTRQT